MKKIHKGPTCPEALQASNWGAWQSCQHLSRFREPRFSPRARFKPRNTSSDSITGRSVTHNRRSVAYEKQTVNQRKAQRMCKSYERGKLWRENSVHPRKAAMNSTQKQCSTAGSRGMHSEEWVPSFPSLPILPHSALSAIANWFVHSHVSRLLSSAELC